MSNFNNEIMEQLDFNNIPLTKQLLINYIGYTYENYADFSDDSLLREWLYLKDENKLQELFLAEIVYQCNVISK